MNMAYIKTFLKKLRNGLLQLAKGALIPVKIYRYARTPVHVYTTSYIFCPPLSVTGFASWNTEALSYLTFCVCLLSTYNNQDE